MTWTKAERELIDEARRLEERRLDLLAQALDLRIMDLMPPAWGGMDVGPDRHEPVEVTFTLGLTRADVRLMRARELRELALFIADATDERRAWMQAQEPEA